jgi:hypothetical protein
VLVGVLPEGKVDEMFWAWFHNVAAIRLLPSVFFIR